MTWGPYRAKLVDWHDGDTCHLDVDLGFGFFLLAYSPITGRPQTSCRVYGINAPELGTDTGKASLAYAQRLVPPGTLVMLRSESWDKYGGRYDGTITLPDGSDFAFTMVTNGQAVQL
jgi:endonuclease YncB( thermonuclease family)